LLEKTQLNKGLLG